MPIIKPPKGKNKVKYYCLTEEGIHLLQEYFGIHKLYIEVSSDGAPKREVGVDHSGKVIHRFPGTLNSLERYGILEGQPIMGESDESLKGYFT